jgi:hypothetical protein
LDTGLAGGQHRHAPRVSQLQRTPHVHGVKDALDGHTIRAGLGDDGREMAVDFEQLVRE